MSFSVPSEFTRTGNKDHEGKVVPVDNLTLKYGTAGFRTHASRLPCAVYRMGHLAAAVSRSYGGQAIGVMITASHNAACDNGLKLIAPLGDMLPQSWEAAATTLANASDADLHSTLDALYTERKLDRTAAALVLCGHDTRSSAAHLQTAVKCAVEHAGATFKSYGELATPQLHFVVRCTNDATYGEPTIQAYYAKLLTAYAQLFKVAGAARPAVARLRRLCQRRRLVGSGSSLSPSVSQCLSGAPALSQLVQRAQTMQAPLQLQLSNTGDGGLNENCGADYVKIGQCAPQGCRPLPDERWASFDGDADRIVYFWLGANGSFHLLDGDRMALLLIDWLRRRVFSDDALGEWSVGVVQTAYANGAAMQYVQHKLGLPLCLVPTGVKHLHHAALQYDVGVYFEANGHGTIVFSDRLKLHVKSCVNRNKELPDAVYERALLLHNFIQLINETVGDALSDLLAVEYVLASSQLSARQWTDMYTEMPSVQIKVQVPDRSLFVPVWDETRLDSPAAVQSAIDAAVAKYAGARCFVRPSGTEDIVRIYAEAEQAEDKDALAAEVKAAVLAAFQ